MCFGGGVALESDLQGGWDLIKEGGFMSCRTDCIYELNAHERHYKVVITSGEFKQFSLSNNL